MKTQRRDFKEEKQKKENMYEEKAEEKLKISLKGGRAQAE